jgi:hypothetical protein
MNKPFTSKRTFAALRLEMLEVRRLLHGGHDELDPHPFELGDLPEPPPDETSTATFPLTSIPALSSYPGAPATLFLDFDGFYEGVWGSYSNITTPVFDQDGDESTFSDGELATIQNVWAQVSEDYAPFRVNVTTVQPPSFANGVALRVAIGGTGSWSGGTYGGIAYVNSFTNSIANTVYVFSDNLSNGYYKYAAEASSHEAGHGFGLQHQSQYDANGVKIAEYYSGSGGRAPIMGNSYSAARGLWWYGTSTSSTTFQDDMAVISRSANGFGYRVDDYGDTATTASPLSGSSPYTASGILTTTSDVDYFAFNTGAGSVTLSVDVPAGINNLDARLELRTDTGALITSAAPSNSFNATITTTLAAGSYRLVVASQGSYGDVGQYTVTATVPASAAPSQVLARSIFYNQSLFDGNNAAIDAADDAAVAPDKVAYQPGDGLAEPEHVTSYTRGINGIAIDLAGDHGPLSLGDFKFRVSAPGAAVNNSPGTWTAAPAPSGFAVRADAGAGGSDRVEIVWPSGSIVNRWLEVIFEGNDAAGDFNVNTGLAASDIFFFGNKLGDTFLFDAPGSFATDATDQLQVRANQGVTLSMAGPFDFNRDALVDATDQLIARFNQGVLAAINIAGSAGAGDFAAKAQSAVASALSVPRADGSGASTAPADAFPRIVETVAPAAPADSRPLPEAAAARVQALDVAIDELSDGLALDDDLLARLAAGV